MDSNGWVGKLLPLAIMAVIMAFRFRRLDRARPLKPARLWILPVIYTLFVGATLALLPPSPMGWGLFFGGLLLGALAGWQRARLMRVEIDAETRTLSMRQSPAALLMILAIAGLRRFVSPARTPGAAPGAAMPPEALLVTDALMGFALGMIVAQQIELWRRANALLAATPHPIVKE